MLAIHELKTTDHYCYWSQNFVGNKGIVVLDESLYVDEAWFHLLRNINSQNTRLWSTENPHATHKQPLHLKKVRVWIAISRKCIVKLIFFADAVNTEKYCSNIILTFEGQLTESDIYNTYFQQDGAEAHTLCITMALLWEFLVNKLFWRDSGHQNHPI